MADSDTSRDDRQLPASARKLQKARDEGNIARSRDVSHALVLGVALLGLSSAGSLIGRSALEIVSHGMRFSRAEALDAGLLTGWFAQSGAAAMWVIVPVCASLAAAGAIATMIPGGVVFSTKPAAPDFGRLNPMNGIARIFSRDSAVDMLKLFALAGGLAVIAVMFASSRFEHFAALSNVPLPAALYAAQEDLGKGIGRMEALLVAIALLDVPLQWFRHRNRLKMTHQEAREEVRESEGDPAVKGRQRQRQREISRNRMLAAVPKADVVITNPTHFAVAIRYDEAGMGAPRVVAKGTDHLAAKIRELAMDAGVPLFEAPPLARALYAHVEIDHEIPATLYTAVAQVLAFVYQLRHWVPGRNPYPREPRDLQVPTGLDPKESA